MTRHLLLASLAVIGAICVAAPALADPCEGRLPSRPDECFAGQVRYVGDGDSLCIGRSPDPAEWIEVRLADFDAPELHEPQGEQTKRFLAALVLGHEAVCSARPGRSGRVISYDRVIALCRVDGVPIGTLLRRAGAPEGGR